MLRIVDWSEKKRQSKIVTAFLERSAFPEEAEKAAAAVLADVRVRGDSAVADCVSRFEGANLKPGQFRISQAELKRADASVPAHLKRAVRDAYTRVMRFSKASLRSSWTMKTPRGGSTGEFFSPMDRVGVYVPGGTAPLASTSIMTVTLARAAGVKEIVACTPAGKTGAVNPTLLYALKLAGATEIYRVGGIQAIGMMAFGTKSCRKVQKIVGPGNAYVTAAKRQVYGYVGIDQVAGPSEIAVLADGTVSAKWVAADLLSQAEHGSGWEKSLLVTQSRDFAEEVKRELFAQMDTLSRKEIIQRVVDRDGILFVVTPSLSEGLELVNRFAPEHFEIMCREATRLMRGVRAAGAVFAGAWTPESAGDFVAGPSHVLPTGGAANMFNGLTPDDFRRRHSFVAFTKADLRDTEPTIAAFAAVEGLDAHGRAASIRFGA
ncbi:MAG: histidinol dehydrogenase [Verrucomicrobiota bacterium]|nr:histidinol dehydrogenase [Verrucomicrobiota bacterium]